MDSDFFFESVDWNLTDHERSRGVLKRHLVVTVNWYQFVRTIGIS